LGDLRLRKIKIIIIGIIISIKLPTIIPTGFENINFRSLINNGCPKRNILTIDIKNDIKAVKKVFTTFTPVIIFKKRVNNINVVKKYKYSGIMFLPKRL
jgi:hypothetical protein